MLTLFGEREVPLGEYRNDDWFVFRVPHNIRYQGLTVVEESVSIDRYTGAIVSTYTTSPPAPTDPGWAAFSGTCSRAEKMF
jgi:hypothetical protein